MTRTFGRDGSGAAYTSRTSMRGSQVASASRTARVTAVPVAALLTPKTRSWMPQPKSGRITRSPGEVARIVQIDCRTLSSPSSVSSIWPPPSRPTGKFHPRPRKSVSAIGQPISTLPAATTVPAGRSAGSLQVRALSPARAAGLPLIFTVALPCWIVALFAGGRWKLVPGAVGRCGGVLSAVLPAVATGMPDILTSELSPPLSTPAKGCGSGVGTGGVPGTMTMCVSTATTRSPCLAAGCPMGSSVLVDVHRAALDGELARRFQVHALAAFGLYRGRGGDLHAFAAQLQLSVVRRDRDVAAGGDRDAVVFGVDDDGVL